jgi:hypothetical protein
MGKGADKQSKTMAIIGFILGIAALLYLLLAIVVWISFWGGIF